MLMKIAKTTSHFALSVAQIVVHLTLTIGLMVGAAVTAWMNSSSGLWG